MERIVINNSQVAKWIDLLRQTDVPPEQESVTHSFDEKAGPIILSNSYLAIVGICHQTSPIGERRLEGNINGEYKGGWDYLKEKFLLKSQEDPKWASPDYWAVLTPLELSNLYEDPAFGKTLNRINERAFLLNDLGHKLKETEFKNIKEAFESCGSTIGGGSGFLDFLRRFEAYNDPVMKKSHFFLSIMRSELGWQFNDKENLLSPVDYHELRGHLRIGTITIQDQALLFKVERGLPLSDAEDTELRMRVQEINDFIGKETGFGAAEYTIFSGMFFVAAVQGNRIKPIVHLVVLTAACLNTIRP